MPHVDGLAVLDQLAGVINGDDYLPVIVLTGDGTLQAKEKALSHGAHDFLSKPLNSTEVQLRVRNLLQTRYMHLQLKAQNESLEQQVWERTYMAENLTQTNLALEETNRRLKEAQTQLIHTEKMASLGQLVAGIAHEINNPLTFVVSNLYTVENGMEHIAPEAEPHLSETSLGKLRKVRARLREMEAGLDRVKDLVLNLRTFSRLDEGEFKTIDVGESIDSILVFLNHKLNDRTEVEKQYGPSRSLSCYPGQLNQVFLNLIANAVDAIAGEGKIVITTSQTDETFVISVRDNGKGIPEAIRGRIFDPFFTTKPVGKGTGLGLAISYGIVQDHHGSIEVQSEEGAGSEFSVRIPRNLESRRLA
jgi:two-component system NtrC family sensor kinase